MAYSICSGNGYGGMQQTLFLGCSISSFSASVGWNQQIGELTVELVRDACAVPVDGNPKIYWDSNLESQTTTAADPGFIEPNIGAPVYFRVGDFEWCGLVQSFEEKNSVGGLPIYTVKLIDPRQVLEGAQIIIGNYAGSVYSTPNLVNVYGFAETYGVAAPLTTIYGSTFGSPADFFGGSEVNDNGMPWTIIQGNLSYLLSAIVPVSNDFCFGGRLYFRDGSGLYPGAGSPSTGVGYGIIPGDGGGYSNYLLDLSEMPLASPYWKLAGTSNSILQAINEICEKASCDYYIELVPTRYNDTLYKVIKIRTASRIVQPIMGSIEEFIADATAEGNVPSWSMGKELRNEAVGAFVVGGYRQNIYQVIQGELIKDDEVIFDSNNDIMPYFGLDPLTGDVIVASGIVFVDSQYASGVTIEVDDDTPYWEFSVSTALLNTQLDYPIPAATIPINELEMLAALGGFDTWYQHATQFNHFTSLGYESDENSPIALVGSIMASKTWKEYYDALGTAGALPFSIDLWNTSNNASRPFIDPVTKTLQTIYDFVLGYAQEYMGRQFMVKLPYIASKRDPENNLILLTDSPADGGWVESGDGVLGLEHPSLATDFFSLQDGRVGPLVSLAVDTSGFDFTKLDKEDILVTSNLSGVANLFIRAEVEPDIVYLDKETQTSPRAVIKISSPINTKITPVFRDSFDPAIGAQQAINLTADSGARDALTTTLTNQLAACSVYAQFPNKPAMIEAAAVPVKSNVHTYGPWYGAGSVRGPIRVEQDQGLVPWEYNGETTLNLAGNAKVFEGVGAGMQIGEMGNIEVVGYPTIPLGAELGAYYNGAFGAGYHLIENRTATTGISPVSSGGYIYVPMSGWTGLYGPNITSINVQVGISQVTTTYGMRTYTPSYGRFSRFNAERLRNDALNYSRTQKDLRLARANQDRLAAITTRAEKALKTLEPPVIAKSKKEKTNTPHEILAGQISPWVSGTSRSIVASYEIGDVPKEFQGGYDTKAFMSMDGFLRPVSMFGAGGLPRFSIIPSGAEHSGYVRQAGLPPLILPSGTGGFINRSMITGYKLYSNNHYLNPLMSHLTHAASGSGMYGSASGHDISILAFGDNPPSGEDSLNHYVRGTGVPRYAEDYRFLALRGPLVLQGWGYDTDGKPMPNYADTEVDASGGIFKSSGLQDLFMDDWLRKSHTWPVGPVDLRFDRLRGVWTVPQYRFVDGVVARDIDASGTGYCQVRYGNYYNHSGELVRTTGNIVPDDYSVPRYILEEPFGGPIYSGEKMISFYEPEKNRYLPLYREPQTKIRGVFESTLAYSGSASFRVWTYIVNSGSGMEQATDTLLTVYDWLLTPGRSIPPGTRGVVYKDTRCNRHYVLEASCLS